MRCRSIVFFPAKCLETMSSRVAGVTMAIVDDLELDRL